jgi:hypothetical protein
MQTSIAESNSPRGLGAEFPAPPRVHWLVLLLTPIIVAIMSGIFAPERYRQIIQGAVDNLWPIYICLWVRKLNPDSNSLFWCDLYVVVELTYAATYLKKYPSTLMEVVALTLALASGILGIATVFIIRSELLKHYNEREPYGLELDGTMTFFFSFLYFQAKLYPIAKAKHEATIRGETISGRPIV